MSKYHFNEIESKWQKYWADNKTFKAYNDSEKPKYYVLDMFPYPSGAGLHVGHPLGYIASDVYSRFKRHQGFNVLHPMGYDSFGLPAEQYAIQTGQHPANTTRINIEGCLDENGKILPQYVNADGDISEDALIEKNIPTNIHSEDYQRNVIKGYRKQMDIIGFSFDWDREVRTSNPEYYKWTQWIFLQLFESWYDKEQNKARAIEELRSIFSSEGNSNIDAECDAEIEKFTASEWLNFEETKKQEILLKYRLTYLAETEVNWCPQLGTVLANDEIVNGVSERGGYPVVRKKMKQWSMRITAYAQRLLDDLEKIDWPQPLKDSQTNWIGRSKGASVSFKVLPPTPSGGGGVEARLTGNSEIIATLLERTKEMRKNPTKAEARLWKELRNKKVDYKFRQQHPIENYIVDFVCLEKKLIIEVDDEIHDYQVQKDGERELLLKEKKGFKIIRFSNNQVLNNLQGVLNEIKDILEVLPSGEDLGVGFSSESGSISVFTTRPDTIFGVSFMVLAPEHDLVSKITTAEQKDAVETYVEATAKRSERDRMSDVKTISGVFTGAYAEHPFSGEKIPVWIGDYVLAGYGTGAVMSVPCGDQRDYDFAKHFNIPIPNIFKDADISEGAYSDKENTIITNSDFLDGLNYQQATDKIIAALEENEVGEGKINYRLRDAVFSRQRYWGEPFPIYYKDGMPNAVPEESLPLHLPEVEKYLPTEEGEPPLGRADVWAWDEEKLQIVNSELINNKNIFALELNTMPGWAGSSWYFFRYMEEKNRDNVFASKAAMEYWKDVDLYIGGSEHATGHLLYSRFWVKFLYDRGLVPVKEPFKKLINQGMILGESAFVHRIEGENKFVSYSQFEKYKTQPIHVDVSHVDVHNNLDIEAFKNWRSEYKNAEFITDDDGTFKVSREIEKMSKSKYNVVNPDDICEQYGADTLRMYEMFLGPLEQAKPWSTAGISGVHSFLKKLWKLYHSSENESFYVSEESASKESLKVLHKTIKKVEEDIKDFSFNTSVSTFMIAVNELSTQKCISREVLESLVILISPYAPHIAEELWEKLGHNESISQASFPKFDAANLVEDNKEYPISFNGKMRFTMELPLNLSKDEIESAVMAHEKTIQYLEGRIPKKVIVVPGKIVNIVG